MNNDATLPTLAKGQAETARSEPWPAPRQAWYAVTIFALALMVNFLDRGIVTLLVEPIKRDLHLTDLQMSVIMGFAFVCFYVIVGFPIARLVDSKSRRLIMGLGITCWSVMTGMCGLAQNFWQLFAARIGVGVGEACSGPATFSMISDLFPPHRLPRAIAVLNFGFFGGAGIALLVGGAIIGALSALPPMDVPLIGTLHGWQLSFLIASIPGLIVALLMTTVREPKRRGRMLDAAPGKAPPLKDVFGFLRLNFRTYFLLFAGLGCNTIVFFGTIVWQPTFFWRTYGWSPAKYGLIQGVIMLVMSPGAALFGSWIAERFARHGREDANMRTVLLSACCYIPGTVAMALMPNPYLAIAAAAWVNFWGACNSGPYNAAFQTITPSRMRGQITALYLFVFNVIGAGMGPTVVALFTDKLYHSDALIGYALATNAMVFAPLILGLFWLTLKPYSRSVAAAAAWT